MVHFVPDRDFQLPFNLRYTRNSTEKNEHPVYRNSCNVNVGGMAIYRILQNSPMGPEEIRCLEKAYEQTLRTIGLKDRNDPITQMIAKKIIEIAQTGVQDPAQLSRSRSRKSAFRRAPSWRLRAQCVRRQSCFGHCRIVAFARADYSAKLSQINERGC
jgi:hypothetical protein